MKKRRLKIYFQIQRPLTLLPRKKQPLIFTKGSENKEKINQLVQIMVCDVSFISLKKVIIPNLNLLDDESIIIVLIKPQFEAKKNELKKGVVRDSEIHERICNDIKFFFELECNCLVEGIIKSPLRGPKGNIEFLIIAKYQR